MTENIEKDVRSAVDDALILVSDGDYDSSIDPASDLLVTGVLDSFGFVQLLLHLEKQMGVSISEDDQLDPRLRSVNGLIDFVGGE